MEGDLNPPELFALPSYEPELHPGLSYVGGKCPRIWKDSQALGDRCLMTRNEFGEDCAILL